MRGSAPSITASPVLVGAVTVLLTAVAVFLAYNANTGLPFVPTYDIRAEVPNGAKLVKGNEVRAGGFLVGTVNGISSERKRVDGEETSIAVLDLRLDKQVEELPADTRVAIRSRSALGLKFVELSPGSSRSGIEPGATIPLANAAPEPLELEDVLSTFDDDTRVSARAALQGFGDALAGRGPSLNVAIAELRPFLARLEPVMSTLSDPETELAGFVRGLAAAASEVAPVAGQQAELFANMADTFAALNRDPAALAAAIEESPPTLEASIESFRVQRPFLANLSDTTRRLRPGAAELSRSLGPLSSALAVGTPVQRRVPQLAGDVEGLFASLTRLGRNPSSLLALRDLRRAVQVTRPAVEFVAPYQTVCNYFNYFFTPLGSHLSAPVPGGTTERILAKLFGEQENTMSNTQSTHPADVPVGQDPQAQPAEQALHVQAGSPAVDSRGRADCQIGQYGYPYRLVTNPRWPPDRDTDGPLGPDEFQGGGSHTVLDPDTPGPAGGTYTSRRLGIGGVEDVP